VAGCLRGRKVALVHLLQMQVADACLKMLINFQKKQETSFNLILQGLLLCGPDR
jgi:hypothetical protein